MTRLTFAYLDGGTGSMILQAVLGGAAGLAVYFKTKGRRLFKRRSDDEARERTDA
jgi:hypothetical protein